MSSSLRDDLSLLYGDRAAEIEDRLLAMKARFALKRRPAFDEKEVVLIAYPDHLQRAGEPPLRTLAGWLREHCRGRVSTVHVLPFHPSTSYEGYAITDYDAVDAVFGTWDDLTALRRDFALMFDFVLNHCSSEHPWFAQLRRGEEPGRRFFITQDPNEPWLREVYRARNSPLLHPVETPEGVRHVWTTYSADLVDLNWREPDVCVEMCRTLLDAVSRGARVIRLDAFVYIWKRAGTRCLDQPEGHALCRVFRALVGDGAAILPSITNVGQENNHAYFADADLIYNLPLSALLLHALYTHDTTRLRAWMRALPTAPPGRAYLNLAASHDGVGLTWLAGLIPDAEIAALIAGATARGALVSSRKKTVHDDDRPWELNTTYFDACRAAGDEDHGRNEARFVATQSVLLALRGVPALYLPSLIGAANDYARVERTGDKRAINRGRFAVEKVEPVTPLLGLLDDRAKSAAFHPDAAQEIVDADHAGVFAVVRGSGGERMLCVTSFLERPIDVSVCGQRLSLAPYGVVWRRV